MKKLILATVIAAASFTASAESSKFEMCKTISSLAEQIMTSRQAGLDMAEMYELSKDSKLGQSMVMMAFDKPLYSTEDYKRTEISKFKNLWFKECIKRDK